MEAKKTNEFRGILDWLDLILGRFSSRTSEDGTRIRSWGVTYMFWMTTPSMIFLLIYGVALFILATSTRQHVPAPLFKAYVACVQKAEAANKPGKCTPPKATAGSKLTAKVLDIGKWPFVLAMFFPALGFLGMIIRNKDDVRALKNLLDTASVFVTKQERIPAGLWEGLKTQLTRVTGAQAGDAPAPDPTSYVPSGPPPGPPPGAVDDAGR